MQARQFLFGSCLLATSSSPSSCCLGLPWLNFVSVLLAQSWVCVIHQVGSSLPFCTISLLDVSTVETDGFLEVVIALCGCLFLLNFGPRCLRAIGSYAEVF